VALACRAVGIDRCVFATVFKAVAPSPPDENGPYGNRPADHRRHFATYSKVTALEELQALAKRAKSPARVSLFIALSDRKPVSTFPESALGVVP